MQPSIPTDRAIYKILTPDQWAVLRRDGQSTGSNLDQTDGFIHFSTTAQLQGTLDLHYKGAGALVLAGVLISALQDRDLRWEPARDGSLFPHLYAGLSLSMIARHWTLHPSADGSYVVPNVSHRP